MNRRSHGMYRVTARSDLPSTTQKTAPAPLLEVAKEDKADTVPARPVSGVL
jgi:hypothetical protein